jgi:hypothetical protein
MTGSILVDTGSDALEASDKDAFGQDESHKKLHGIALTCDEKDTKCEQSIRDR